MTTIIATIPHWGRDNTEIEPFDLIEIPSDEEIAAEYDKLIADFEKAANENPDLRDEVNKLQTHTCEYKLTREAFHRNCRAEEITSFELSQGDYMEERFITWSEQ